ncbi:hypothetical protein LCGC14_1958880, partial [marine sediment metagenome]
SDGSRHSKADALKEQVQELMPEFPASLYSDLLQAAIDEINFHEIIENQKEYIKEIKSLNENINKNSEKDLITLEAIQKHNTAIEELGTRIDKSEVNLRHFTKINNRLSSIEKLLTIHDQELAKLKTHG